MRLSHSRVETFKKCPYQFKLHYVDELETLPKDDPANALVLGHAIHSGIEKESVEAAIEEYYNAYPIITDRHVEEAIKLEYWLPKIFEAIPKGGKHEIEISDGDNFIGFIDYLVPTGYMSKEHPQNYYGEEVKTYDLYDWKYSNNVKNYLESGQLHEYKYYFEKLNPGKKIRNMYFMFIPKSQLRIKYKNKTNKRDEKVNEFRKRILADLNGKELQFVKIDYNPEKVIEFLNEGIRAINCTEYIKNPTHLCDWCDFKQLCESEDDVNMALPSTQRRKIEGNSFKKIWFYGMPFSGKTFLANKFDTPLMLNTDGNFKQVDAPVLRIMDEVTTEGRITKRKYAWEVFKEAVEDLEKGSGFKTVVVDLLEDVYDACRVKVCVDNGWDHESDDSFKAYDIVRNEFLRTLKRLLNLDYNIVLISHEDTSRDILKKSGDKITAIKPNLNDKVALKVAGMVDIACRVVNDDDKRTIRFKSSDVEFGGGRLTIRVKEIPCEYEELMKIYNSIPESSRTVTEQPKEETRINNQATEESASEDKPDVSGATEGSETTETSEKTEVVPTRRRRKTTESEEPKEAEKTEEPAKEVEKTATEESTPRRRRRIKTEDPISDINDTDIPF